MNERILDISWLTIVRLAIAGLLVYVFFQVRDILVWVLFGVILSILFDPVIDRFQRYGIPRTVSTVGIYLLVFGLIGALIYAIAPFFIQEIQRFADRLPLYFEQIAPTLGYLGAAAFSDLPTFTDTIVGNIEQLSTNIIAALFAVFGGVFSTVFVVTIGIFLSLEERSVEKTLSLLFPKRHERTVLDLWRRSQRKVSGWFLSRLLSSLFVGAATYLALVLFEVPYPFSLGSLAFISNFVPIVGPLVMGILIAVLVAAESLTKAIFVVLAFILIQQIESSILTPVLSKRFIGLPPALVLIALAIGGELWGVMGAILAIPLFGIIFEFVRDFLKRRREESPAPA